MKKLLNIGNSVFFVFASLWTYFAVYFSFQFLNTDYMNLTRDRAIVLVSMVILLFLVFHFRKSIKGPLKKVYYFVIDKKIYIMLIVLLIQLLITVTSLGLAAADTTIIYNIVTSSNYASHIDYISMNPNNFLLVIWMKFNYILFKTNVVVALAIWNILFIDAFILIIYHIHKSFFPKLQANISFILLVLIIGLSPQYLYTYSDSITLFLLSLFVLLVVFSVRNKKNKILSFLSGTVLAIAYGFRPTVLIFVIAGFIVLLYSLMSKKYRNLVLNNIKSILIVILSFFIFNRALSYALNHQQIVSYEPNQSRTLLYYADLGLTYSGNIHSEISRDVWVSKGDNRNKLALEEIKTRLDSYSFTSFTGHLFYKFYWITGEGMFGWIQERVLSEKVRMNIHWLKKIQDTHFASWVRTYIYAEGKNYFYYASFIQMVWIIISIGLVLSTFFFSRNNAFQLWMQISLFGGILFLMLFEGGRTRYMIQFLPAIITVSSQGLFNTYMRFKHTSTSDLEKELDF